MANYLGSRLSRLVRRRAYLAGDITKLEEQIADLQCELAAAEQAVANAWAELATLDSEIEAEPGLEVNDIRAIRAIPRATGGKHGEFVRELVRLLRDADGPVDMEDLVAQMASRFSVPISTGVERKRFGGLVRRATNKLRKKSAVVRLPAEPGKTTGVWRWIAD